MHQRTITRFRLAQMAVGLGLFIGIAQAQQTIVSDVVTLRTDADTGKIVIELVGENGQRLVVTASQIEIATADNTAVTGTLGLTAAGAVELCPPAAQPPRVVIGLTTEPVALALAAQLSLDAANTVIVADVATDLPAYVAGIHVHDVITSIDETEVVTQDSLSERIAQCTPGDVVRFNLLRAGKPIHRDVVARAYVDADVALHTQWMLQTLRQRAIAEALFQPTVTWEQTREQAWIEQVNPATESNPLLSELPLLGELFRVRVAEATAAESEPKATLREALNDLRAQIDNIETLLDALDAEPAQDKKD